MATRASKVFNMAMALMDETSDTDEYRDRSLPILNTLRNELYPYSDTFDYDESGRAVATEIKTFDSVVDLDDYLAQTVMPYGLAAHLLLSEDAAQASFFQQRYEELRNKASIGRPAVSEDIEDVCFGGTTYSEFARW